MRAKLAVGAFVAAGAGLLLSPSPARAHHAFAAEFDANKPVHFPDATVTKVMLINPHSWITIDVKRPDGTMQTWEIEAGAPNAMFRRGFTKDSLPLGTDIVVTGYLAKNGTQRVNGRDLTLPDGRKLFMATSNPFDPDNDKDK